MYNYNITLHLFIVIEVYIISLIVVLFLRRSSTVNVYLPIRYMAQYSLFVRRNSPETGKKTVLENAFKSESTRKTGRKRLLYGISELVRKVLKGSLLTTIKGR